MRFIEFRTASVDVHPDRVYTRFREDGSECAFFPPVGRPEFDAAAREMGYVDPMLYGIEHDLTHHFVADELGWPHSWSIWSAAHPPKTGTLQDSKRKWSQRVSDEEHIVNRLQLYMNTGRVDEDYGVLLGTWPHNLPEVAGRLVLLLRPWLRF